MFFQSLIVEKPHEHAILLKYIINSYCQRLDDEEKEIEVFTAMIKESIPYNIEELREKNKELKTSLKEVEMEMDVIQELKEASARHDEIVKQYEDYFAKMREHQKKRNVKIEKFLEQLSEKEAMLTELQNVLAQKQAAYDAQGFDGKKQLCYFENQKKELMEKLQSKKTTTKKLTSDCHDADILYSKTLDEGASVCDTFNELYLKINAKVAGSLDALKNLNDPLLKNVCSSFTFEFPDCKMLLNHQNIHQLGDERKRVLNEIKKRFDSATLILNSVAAKQNENLQEILMRKPELAIKIKVASSQETKNKQDLHVEEKLLSNEAKTYEAQCEELLKKLDEVRKETDELKKLNLTLKEEYDELIAMRKKKEKMFENYLEKQKQMVAHHAINIKALKENVENAGSEIYDALSKMLEKPQE